MGGVFGADPVRVDLGGDFQLDGVAVFRPRSMIELASYTRVRLLPFQAFCSCGVMNSRATA